ncbi:MAG: Lrp/AsnC family transcriptional regulator [Sphingobacterium sp.]|jgi:DNA-binding Lrp family transcriptional regulator|nr:Lrp/AsnC family transcriptional regulator [Sphingobacterium sp.]
MNLDQTDIKLLRLLQENGALSNKDLSFKINKSITAVHERVRRLKENGYIKNVVAILDRQKIGIGLISFSQVFLVEHNAESLKKFEDSVAQFGEVMECFQMSGSYDFLLRVATRDMEGYHMFLRNKLAVLPNVDKVQTFFVLSESKFETGYPIL